MHEEARSTRSADLFARARPSALSPATMVGILIGLVVAKALYYLHLGAGLFLDDWRLVDNTRVYGVFQSLHGDHDMVSRPVAWVWFNIVYGISGNHPGRLLLFVTVLNVGVVVLLFRVLGHLVPRSVAFAVAVVWILLPTHTSLTVWGGIVQALLALCLLLGGLLAIARGRWVPAAACFVAAALCYQVVIPVALLGAVAFPTEGELRLVDRAKVVVATLLALGWVALHPTYPTSFQVPDVLRLWRAHFGTGLLASEASPVAVRTGMAVLVLVGVVVCLVAGWRGARARNDGPFLVALGLAVWFCGLVVLASTPQWVQDGEYGITDRIFGVSSIGAALVLVGIGVFLWRRWHAVALGFGGALVLVCLWGQFVALNAWSQAGHDATAMLDRLGEVVEFPNRTQYLVGPGYPVRDNVWSLEADSVYFAHKLAYPPGNSGTVRFFDDAFLPLPTDGQVLVLWPTVSDDLPDRFYEPIVRLDPVVVTPTGLHVTGFALHRSSRRPVSVDISIDDAPHPAATIERAVTPRVEIDEQYGVGDQHGFDAVIDDVVLSAGEHQVCARGRGRGSGSSPASYVCLAVTVPSDIGGEGTAEPVPDPSAPPATTAMTTTATTTPEIASPVLGAIDGAVPVPSGIEVTGWAMDGVHDAPMRVAFFVDGDQQPYGQAVASGVPRPDLRSYGFGTDHGFSQVVGTSALASGSHRLCMGTPPAGDGATAVVLDCVDLHVGG